MSQPVKKKKAKKAATPSPAASGSGDSAASDQSLVVPAPETDAAAPPTEPADPLAIDNFALSPAIKGLLRKKGIEALFQIQVELVTDAQRAGLSRLSVAAASVRHQCKDAHRRTHRGACLAVVRPYLQLCVSRCRGREPCCLASNRAAHLCAGIA